MKKRLLTIAGMFLAFIFVFIPAVAIGQEAIYDIPGLKTDNSIVREFQSNEFVIFNEQPSPSFVLVDLNAVTVKEIDCKNIHVTDFEIYQGKVYFCGSDATGPVVGIFNIYSTFGGITPIEYVYFPPSSNCNSDFGTDNITGFKKIEVLDNGTTIHMIMICEATQSVYPGQLNRGIVDVFNNGSGWEMYMHQENSAVYYYDDIAVTDNLVIAIGHKNQSNAIYYSYYYYPVGYSSFLDIGCGNFQNYFHLGGGNEFIIDNFSEVAIEHIQNDMFATVCYGKYRNSTTAPYSYGTVLCLYWTAGIPANFYAVDPYNFVYSDLKYNSQTESLMLLPGKNSPNLNNGYIEFKLDLSTLTILSQTAYLDTSNSKYNSLDATNLTFPIGQTILTGVHNGYMRIWRHLPLSEMPCTTTIILDGYDVIKNCYGFDFPFLNSNIKLSFIQFSPNVWDIDIDEICVPSK